MLLIFRRELVLKCQDLFVFFQGLLLFKRCLHFDLIFLLNMLLDLTLKLQCLSLKLFFTGLQRRFKFCTQLPMLLFKVTNFLLISLFC